MPLLKPPRGTQIDITHPLARNIAVCWLFNEGSGARVFDLSGNSRTGTRYGDPSWVAGKFGSALEYDGDGDSVDTSSPVISSVPVSASLWFKVKELPSTRVEDGTLLIQRTIGNPYQSFRTLIDDANDKILLLIYNISGVSSVSISSDSAVQAGIWYHAVFVLDSDFNACMYVNGIKQTSTGNSGSFYNANDVLRIGLRTGTADDFKGTIDLVTIFNRSLSANEVTLLYRDPFCLFERASSSERAFACPSVISLSGSTSARAEASGTLMSHQSMREVERDWLREALFNGVTSKALKLGTTLSSGWFWLRTSGCSALYRGRSMDEIDFADVLAVTSRDADIISPAGCVPHVNSSTYFYVLRRFNGCGYQERTLAAAAKVSLGTDGGLVEPQPNEIVGLKAEQTNNTGISLTWFYCQLDQKSPPARFNIYSDNGTGQVDYATPLASVGYRGRRFYMYQSDALEPGEYLLDVRVEDAHGVESSSSGRLAVQVNVIAPDSMEILSACCL